jgi:hypothetical protein
MKRTLLDDGYAILQDVVRNDYLVTSPDYPHITIIIDPTKKVLGKFI